MALAWLQVSFVNSINTIKGGTHANYIADGVSACVPAAAAPLVAPPPPLTRVPPALPRRAASCWSAS